MTTNTTTTIMQLVEKATHGWSGMTWDSAPATVEKALAQAVSARRDLDADADGDTEDGYYRRQVDAAIRRAVASCEGSLWLPDNGSHSSQTARRDWRDLARETEALTADSSVEDIETARQHAEWLADAEREYVSGRAAEAAEHGAAVVEAAQAGDWDTAVEEAREACRVEREFGDDPTWRQVREAVEAAATAEEEREEAQLEAIETATDSELWDSYMGSQSPSEWLALSQDADSGLGIESEIRVDLDSMDLARDLTLDAKDALAAKLAAYIERKTA